MRSRSCCCACTCSCWLAGFVAPYDPVAQARALPFAPPTRLHVVDANGEFHCGPSCTRRCRTRQTSDGYVEDTTQRFPVQLMVAGDAYTLLPGIESRRHLFGVDAPARISLLGTDGFGRDVLLTTAPWRARLDRRRTAGHAVRAARRCDVRHARRILRRSNRRRAHARGRPLHGDSRGSICCSRSAPRCPCTSTRAPRS